MDVPEGWWERYPATLQGGTIVYDWDRPLGPIDPLMRRNGERLLIEDFASLQLDQAAQVERFLHRWGPILQLRAAEFPVDRSRIKAPSWGWTHTVPDGEWRHGERPMRVESNWWASVRMTFSGFAPAEIVYHRRGEEDHPYGAPADRDEVLSLIALQAAIGYVADAIDRGDAEVAQGAINEQVQWIRTEVRQGGSGPKWTYRASSLVPFMFFQLAYRLGEDSDERPRMPPRCRHCGVAFVGGGRRLFCSKSCGTANRVRRFRERAKPRT